MAQRREPGGVVLMPRGAVSAEVSDAAFRLLAGICVYAQLDSADGCWRSAAGLAAECRMSESAYHRARRELEAAGLVRSVPRFSPDGRQQSNRLVPVWAALRSGGEGAANGTPEGVRNGTPEGAENGTQKHPGGNTQEEEAGGGVGSGTPADPYRWADDRFVQAYLRPARVPAAVLRVLDQAVEGAYTPGVVPTRAAVLEAVAEAAAAGATALSANVLAGFLRGRARRAAGGVAVASAHSGLDAFLASCDGEG